MLRLVNINIHFREKEVISDSKEIIFHDGTLNVITGKSGSGKTSLLNLIGLISDPDISKCQYFYNQKEVDIHNQTRVNDFKRSNISYVFQDYNLFGQNTVQDNFNIYASIMGNKIAKEEMTNFLSMVNINEDLLKKKVKSLSGGERQRIAIALALVKKPGILLLDEPTANLDEENTKQVITILHELKEDGMIIIVSTHQPEIFDGDAIYRIENKKITIVKESATNISSKPYREERFSKRFYRDYGVIRFNSHKMINSLMIFVLSICIALVSFISVLGKSSQKRYLENINELANDEIFLMNDFYEDNDTSIFGAKYEFYRDESITDEQFEEIKAMPEVENVYFYKSFMNNGVYYDEEAHFAHTQDKDEHWISLLRNGELEKEEKYEGFGLTTIDEKKISNRLLDENSDIDEGIYISNVFAEKLGIEDINDLEVEFRINVPIAQMRTEGGGDYIAKTTGKTTVIRPSALNVHKILRYPVKGIIQYNDNSLTNFDSKADFFYLDYHLMDEIQKKTQDEHQEWLDIFRGKSRVPFSPDEIIYSENINSSSLIIELKDYRDIEKVEKELFLMSEYFKTKTQVSNIESINAITNQSVAINIVYPILITVVLIVLFAVIYFFDIKKSKNDFALLKAYGVKDIAKAMMGSLGVSLVFLMVLSIVELMIMSSIATNILNWYIIYDYRILLYPILLNLAVFIIPAIISRYQSRKIDVATLIRAS